MDVVARETRWVTGRSPEHGGAGDSSILTAYGLFQGMRASAEHAWGTPSRRDRRAGVAGVGKVGRHLLDHLLEDGATVVVTDVSEAALARIGARHPGVDIAADVPALLADGLDVYAPCALGGAPDEDTVAQLTATIVCGAANNQLAHPGVEKLRRRRPPKSSTPPAGSSRWPTPTACPRRRPRTGSPSAACPTSGGYAASCCPADEPPQGTTPARRAVGVPSGSGHGTVGDTTNLTS
ncbi:MAG: hypothetical protein ACR2JQ_07605 [Mycobacteriales bacterium]